MNNDLIGRIDNARNIGGALEKTTELGGKIDRTFLNGLSAYEIAVKNGFTGTEAEWLTSLNGQNGVNGVNGNDGADGYSPTVTTAKSGDTTTITFTDKNGAHVATVKDGKNGTDGANGQNGTNGISPKVTINKSGNVTTIKITDVTGTHTATINDGVNGIDGKDGENGSDASVTAQSIADALGYTPANSTLAGRIDAIEAKESSWDAKSDFDGNYNSLTNRPVLFDGNYNSLSNKPTIPDAVTDSHINSLIDLKLGVVENGAY